MVDKKKTRNRYVAEKLTEAVTFHCCTSKYENKSTKIVKIDSYLLLDQSRVFK